MASSSQWAGYTRDSLRPLNPEGDQSNLTLILAGSIVMFLEERPRKHRKGIKDFVFLDKEGQVRILEDGQTPEFTGPLS